MLAKSKSDTLAKRAVLSAPSRFLPRLLFCSSLPRASFVAILGRLGRLGDGAIDKEELYGNLMSPSALSEWDIGRVGLRRDATRKLLGRLSAYLRIHNACFRNEGIDISTTFLSWLIDECKLNLNKSTKDKRPKKATTAAHSDMLSNVTAASCFLSRMENEIPPLGHCENITLPDTDHIRFHDLEQLPLSVLPKNDKQDWSAAQSQVACCIKNGHFVLLDEVLECCCFAEFERNRVKAKLGGIAGKVELSVELLKCVYALRQPKRGASIALLKWIPRLSSARGSPELWTLIFSLAIEPCQVTTSGRLLSKCIQSWSTQHLHQCTDWILGVNHSVSNDFDYEGIAMFLVSCSGHLSAQHELFTDFPFSDSGWVNSKELLVTGALIAFRSLKQRPNLDVFRCSSLPSGFTLLFLLSRCGKKHLRSICEMILEELSKFTDGRPERAVFQVLLLRLYLNFPHWMDLGLAAVRNSLMRASETFSTSWTYWLSSFDGQIDDLLHTIGNGEMKSVKQLADLSRKQPLLILRKLPIISGMLWNDGTTEGSSNKMGSITGENLSGKLHVKFHGKVLMFSVLHWGYNYAEPLWVSFLDVLSSMPREVLFTCGVKVGLLDLLAIYVQLVSVQLQLLSAAKAMRLKTKLTGAFTVFKQINPAAWTEWLTSVVGDTQMRHLLVLCDFISPQEARECVK